MSSEIVKKGKKAAIAAEDGAFRDAEVPIVSIMRPVMVPTLAVAKVDGLTQVEWQTADRVVRRLHEQIRSFLGGLPLDARNASGLARFLGIDRTTCQRLVFAASRPYIGLSIVDRLPGVRGLRQLVDAASKMNRSGKGGSESIDGENLIAFAAAVDQFENVLRSLGISQSALARKIVATPPADTLLHQHAEPIPARQRLFEAAAELTGRSSQTWVAVYVYQPLPSDDSRVCVARSHGLIGHTARADAVPLTFHNFTSKNDDSNPNATGTHPFHNLDDSSRDDMPVTVLRQFCTDPPPVVSSRQPGEYLVQAIDTDPTSGGTPIDFMLGTRTIMPHPAKAPPRIEEVWAMINFPVRRMVFDVYLHRDMARTCIPSLDMHLWRPDFMANIGDRWQTRFANAPRLELLGAGITHAATPAYARHAELTSFLFERLELPGERFIGYRCAVDFPVWRTGYCMSFDFNTGEDDES